MNADLKAAPNLNTHRWDSGRNRWVPLRIYNTEGNNMRPDFVSLDGPGLVQVYNEMAIEAAGLEIPVAATKRFSSREAGLRRCEDLYKALCTAKGTPYEEAPFEEMHPIAPKAMNGSDVGLPAQSRTQSPAQKREKKGLPPVKAKAKKKAKATTKAAQKAKPKTSPSKEDNRTAIAKECGVRGGTNRDRLINCLYESVGKQVSLKAIMKAIYGPDANGKSDAAFSNVLKGTQRDMKNAKCKYEIVAGNDKKETSYGLVITK